MKLHALICGLFIALLNPAHATPEEMIEVSETLLGINDTHLFVLRRIDNNLSYHMPTQTDVMLIARNRTNNTDDQVWPVMRMVEYGASYKENHMEERVEILPLPDRVNPFDILLWRKAIPFMGAENMQVHSPYFYVSSATTQFSHADRMLTIKTNTRESIWTSRISDQKAAELIENSLKHTRATIAAYVPPHYLSDDVDGLRGIKINAGADCQIIDTHLLYEVIDAQDQFFQIAQIRCGYESDVHPVSMFLIFQPDKEAP